MKSTPPAAPPATDPAPAPKARAPRRKRAPAPPNPPGKGRKKKGEDPAARPRRLRASKTYELVRDDDGKLLVKARYEPLCISSDTWTKRRIKGRAASLGLSVSAWINTLIRKDLLDAGLLALTPTQPADQLPDRVSLRYAPGKRRRAKATG